jgi:PAS domain S-box-containing protein
MLVLIALILVPALVLSVYTAFEQRRQAAEHATENALRLTYAVAESQKRTAEAARHLLVGLSQVPAVRSGDAAECSALMANLLRQHPGYANLGVILPGGEIACSAVPVPAGSNIAGSPIERGVRHAIETGERTVQDYLIGNLTGKPIVMLSYPDRGAGGSVERVIFASLDLGWLSEIATGVQLPPSSTLTVFTAAGTVLARFPDPEQWVGQSVPEAPLLRAILQHHGEGTARISGLDGIRRLYAFTGLHADNDEEGVYVSIGIPESFVFASANRALARNLALLTLVALLALLAAWIGVERFVLQPIDALLEATRRFTAGDLSIRSDVRSGPNELLQLATAFDQMAEALQSRTLELERRAEAIRESEERYRLVARATNEVIYDWNVEANDLMWNDALYRVLGLDRAQVEPTIEWWEQQIHPADREVVVSSLQSVVDGGGESWVEEYRFRRGDGTYAAILDRGYVVRSEQGAPVRMIGSMLDLTERKRAEEAQQFLIDASRVLASSIDYRTTLRSVAEIAVSRLADICVVDLVEEDGTIRREVSAHADTTKQELLLEVARRFPPGPENQSSAAAVVLRTGRSVFIPEVTDELLEREIQDDEHRRLLQALAPRSHITVPLIARGRSLGALSLTAVAPARPYTEADLALAEDLGTRAAYAIDNALLYSEAQAAREEAEAANKAKSGFLAVMSHELRTPLTSVISFAELLDAEIGGTLTAQQHEQVGRISSSGWHLTRLVEEILEYTRVEAGRAVVQSETVDVAEIAREAVAQMTPLASERALPLRADLPDHCVSVQTDPAKMRQILLNLLSNAVKFTDTGEIRLELSEADQHVTLRVHDTGVGIAPENHSRIFEAFWQAEAPLTRRAGGTGLGLSIVRQLTRLLGGEIGVESTEGAGSVFTVKLPRRLANTDA